MMAGTRYPRLCRGLVMAPDGDALLVDGGPRRRKLTGKSVTSLLPRVLPLLDGTRQSDSIAAATDLDQSSVDRLLAVLDGSGLLEWPGHPSTGAADAADHVTAYFSRTMSVVPGMACTEDLAWALGGAAALLVASEPIAATVAADLAETGIGDVSVRNAAHPVGPEDITRLARSPRRLVAVLDDGGPALAGTVMLTRGSGVPVLRFADGADNTEIGPVFYDGWTPCVRCFRAGYADLGGAALGSRVPSGVTAALLTAEIMMALAHTGNPSRPWRMTRVTRPAWRTESFDVLPATGCAACGCAAPPAGTGTAEALALAYEWQHHIRPAVLTKPKIRTRDGLRRIAALQHERDPFPPAPARDLGGELSAGAGRLAELLACTAGFRTPPPGERLMARWAPSGGNLGSVQLYVVTERDLFGLPGTLFRYDDLGHRILPVRADRVPLDSLLAARTGCGPRDVALIFVVSVSRIAHKYEEFALRLSHLDTGCAALQLSVAAAARGVAVSFAPSWSAGLFDLLELEAGGELVTAVAVVDGASLEGATSCR
ncbi:MAG: nitroreductase family protein [Streptosporangiaceae bacterium]|nr:nitroreductase family protein [Streptosporangiaceae bacterium]